MYRKILMEKLNEQKSIYEAYRAGNKETVVYKEQNDEEWGISDANYLNRERLAYYFMYNGIDDEKTFHELFLEELTDRETNDFQGIGDTLNILTCLLKKYNSDGRYNALFQRAKEANFDCWCGYSPDDIYDYEKDDINDCDIITCMWIAKELDYKDVLEKQLAIWIPSVTEWNEGNCSLIIEFNEFLENYSENVEYHKKRIDIAENDKEDKYSDWNVMYRYSNLLHCYIQMKDYQKAYPVFEKVSALCWESNNFYRDILFDGIEIVLHDKDLSDKVWKTVKAYLEKEEPSIVLYEKAIQAAEHMKDGDYAESLKKACQAERKRLELE